MCLTLLISWPVKMCNNCRGLKRRREINASKDERKEFRWLMTSSHNRGPSRCPSPDYVALVGVNFTPGWA